MRRIALLTDFGTRDSYVASMKGVLAGRTAAPVHDLTHEIAPFDIWEAAWFLRTAAPWWPEATIFVCVVDPGVGSARRIIAAEVAGQVFLAPDNGLLAFVLGTMGPMGPMGQMGPMGETVPSGEPHSSHRSKGSYRSPGPTELYSVENTALFLETGSTTFHGRDRFAPAAAALANGAALVELGPRITELVTLNYQPPTETHGTIVHIDRFGNAITDITPPAGPYIAKIGELTIDRIETAYADAGPGPFLIAGSGGTVEISLSNANAAKDLQLNRGDRLEVCLIDRQPPGASLRR